MNQFSVTDESQTNVVRIKERKRAEEKLKSNGNQWADDRKKKKKTADVRNAKRGSHGNGRKTLRAVAG